MSWKKGCACCKLIAMAGAVASRGTALGCCIPILLSHLVWLAGSLSPAFMDNMEQ